MDESKEIIAAIKESLIEYSGPIYICGKIFDITADSLTTIYADKQKEELDIINNKYPEWIKRVMNNETKKNVLLIKNFDQITFEQQKLFVELICNNCISSERLPENLRIIINAEEKCQIIPEIQEIVQYYEV